MSLRLKLKNKNFIISKRDFLSDYSLVESKRIDMTLSGKYLSNYCNFILNVDEIDDYPFHKNINELKDMIKQKFDTDQSIIIGNGVNGLIQNIIKIFFMDSGNLVTPYYTFNQAEFGVTSFKGYTKRVFCNNYEVDLEKIEKSIDKKTKMVYICNPNNPTGLYIDSSKLLDFVKKVKIPVVIDESGIEFTGQNSVLDYPEFPSNLIVLRSFSKAYGLANLRIGFLVCSSEFNDIYSRNITINEFSGISCDVAKKVLNSSNVKDNVNAIINERKQIEMELTSAGLELLDSYSNIIMTRTIFPSNFIDVLRQNDVSVVPVIDENGGLHFRMAVQDHETNQEFVKVLKKVLGKNS